MSDNNLNDNRLNFLARFLSTKTGLSTALITAAISISAPIVTHIWTHKTAYNQGQKDYETALKQGTAKLDGKIIAIIDQDQKQADSDADYLRGQVDGFNHAQTEFTRTLESINASHANSIAAIGQRDYTPAQNAWRSNDVPDATRLRLNRLTAARRANHSVNGLSKSNN